MKTAVVAALATAGVASAFVAPFTGTAVSGAKSSSALRMTYDESTPGVTAPLGYFDPLGILKDGDEAKFFQWRAAEIKHGRVSQLAVVGHLVQEAVRLPGGLGFNGELKFDDIPNGIGAFTTISGLGLAQLFFFIGYLDNYVFKQVEGSIPGDVGLRGPFDSYSPEQQKEYQDKEINQGRAAMMGILALITHGAIDGHPYVINDLIGAPY